MDGDWCRNWHLSLQGKENIKAMYAVIVRRVDEDEPVNCIGPFDTLEEAEDWISDYFGEPDENGVYDSGIYTQTLELIHSQEVRI